MSEQFIMAWDSSNSKTQVKIRTLESKESYDFVVGTVKPDGEIPSQVESLFNEIMQELNQLKLELSACRVVCAGLSSYHRPNLAEELRHGLEKRGFKGLIKLTGDFEIALWGALGQIPDENGMIPGGAVLISGKGSICYGQSPAGKRQRTGGFGPMLDDAGSGFAIGRDILSAIVKSSDKRLGKTALSDIVFEQLNISSVGDLLLLVNNPQYQLYDHAYLAPALDIAYEKNDAIAAWIVDTTVHDLMDLARPVIDGLGLSQGHLGLAGGILLKSNSVREKTLAALREAYPDLHINSAEKSAVEAALEYAEKLA